MSILQKEIKLRTNTLIKDTKHKLISYNNNNTNCDEVMFHDCFLFILEFLFKIYTTIPLQIYL